MEIIITAAFTTAAFAMPFVGHAIARAARKTNERAEVYDPTCHIKMATNLKAFQRQAS